ncbi:6-phosphofructo-2-kinase [Teratosphaeria destructans]|uniref:6-phosphofructo-2-kinase n=1 Tax=Teratosphaeria destructans TaxID=418781 RepID=A0A9W7SZ79_9PEZI|nr:6-phosphofructo-2-kinase [Teratosphaeria destructans]
MASSGSTSPSITPVEQRRCSDDERVDELRTELDRTLSAEEQSGSQPQSNSNRSASGNGVQVKQFDVPKAALKPTPHMRQGSLAAAMNGKIPEVTGASIAMNDTPATTAPGSPNLKGEYFPPTADGQLPPRPLMPPPIRQNSGTSTPRVRPTTLDIPGLTKSKVSPDGRIASRDVGAKLVIVMVGLPARGKSYITKKLARYLNWLQHDTRIFNVGERRRVVAGGPNSLEKTRSQQMREAGHRPSVIAQQQPGLTDHTLAPSKSNTNPQPASVAKIVLNGETKIEAPATPPVEKADPQYPANGVSDTQHSNHDRSESSDRAIDMPDMGEPKSPLDRPKEPQIQEPEDEAMDQNAAFFDPENKKASLIREQVARETLDELLDYILDQGGSVGILDATNSTLERRKMVMDRIRERAGPDLNVLFLESRCVDQDLLEANMRLKLGGPDYRDMDPVVALEDFKKRVQVYEKAYVPLGEYEEKNNMPYIQMIDVGRKIVSHQVKGFLSAQANYYLLNFNLAPRQIWITRHGLSQDNQSGKIGGDSDLAPEGIIYARSLARFMDYKRREWDLKQVESMKKTHFPPQPGDVTPPNPYWNPQSPSQERNPAQEAENGDASASESIDEIVVPDYEPKPFCVWTSMLKRSIQTAKFFNDEEYDTKQMRMLDELNAGVMEGLTYNCISTQFPEEYRSRKSDKLHYRYPGPGGEGYLDIINRLRPVIVELERMTDHVLLVGHRSVARVLLAYFRGLKREEVADLDVPLGMLYCLEPKPYGVDFKVYKWDRDTEWFYELPDFKLKAAEDDMQ